jgi:hypothetical protein
MPETDPRGNFPRNSLVLAGMTHKKRIGTMDMDRRPIRIDLPPAHMGVMAALRHAFEAAAREPSDRDFAELLRKLN